MTRQRALTLQDACRRRVLILDGAMGTRIQRLPLTEHDYRGERFGGHPRDLRGNFDLLVLTRPDLIAGIHDRYLEAGADILKTHTFAGTDVAQARFGLSGIAYDLNVAAARLARDVAAAWSARTPERPRWVAGTVGPIGEPPAESAGDSSSAAGRSERTGDAYVAQVEGLLDGGVDLLLIETMMDTRGAVAALGAAHRACVRRDVVVPIIISASVGRDGQLADGSSIESFCAVVMESRPFSVGLNCSLGAAALTPVLRELSRVAPTAVSCHPSAGLPNPFGGYDDRPADFARLLGEWAREGLLNIVGGCCGTTPEHVRALAAACAGIEPRMVPGRTVGNTGWAKPRRGWSRPAPRRGSRKAW